MGVQIDRCIDVRERPDLFSTKKAVSDVGAIFAVFSCFLSFILLFEALFYGNRALF